MILLGNRIKELRKKNKFTQTELAEKVGVTKSTVAAYENDTRTPSYEVLIKLAEVFKVTLDYMVLNRKDEKSVNVSGLTTSQIIAIENMVSCFEHDNKQLRKHGHIFNDEYLNRNNDNKLKKDIKK